MTTQSQSGAHSPQISVETKRLLRDFARAAIASLSERLNNEPPEWEAHSQWERGNDGHFREVTKQRRVPWRILDDDFLRSLPEYTPCVEGLKSDPVVGRHLDRLVGTSHGDSRIDSRQILRAAIYKSLSDGETVAFSQERFDQTWLALAEFFCAARFAIKMVAPLPGLVVPEYPLHLSDELVLDRLTEDEVTRCSQIGLLQPIVPRSSLIQATVAVGIRQTIFLPKRIGTGVEAHEVSDSTKEGSIGRRPALQAHLVVDEVISALRLFKHSPVYAAGYASWTESSWLNSGISYRVLRQESYWGRYELSASDVAGFLDLWHLLEERAAPLGFSIRRYNLSFDRELLDDRIVDLVIAAESLLLGDLDANNRGELSFRFALRAAKFIDHPEYGEHEIYQLMRQAYHARSAIVHGGKPKKIKLPNKQQVELRAFTDVIEELVRRGLRKALAVVKSDNKLRNAEFWLNLILSE